jgi:hypothetical protein
VNATLAGGGPDAPRVLFEPAQLELGFGTVDFLQGAQVWIVPAASLAVPGLLLLLFVALQAVGALAWVPAVRRLRGEDDQAI